MLPRHTKNLTCMHLEKQIHGRHRQLSIHMSYCSYVQLFATLWTVAHETPLSMGFSREEYWNGLPFPSPGDLPDAGIEPISLLSPALAGGIFTTRATQAKTYITEKKKKRVIVVGRGQKGGNTPYLPTYTHTHTHTHTHTSSENIQRNMMSILKSTQNQTCV